MQQWRPLLFVCLAIIAGCGSSKREYGAETPLAWPGPTRQVWAIAPAINLSGQKIDLLIQGDLVHEHVGKVQGITPLPVNSVADVFRVLRIEQVQSEEQAALVCDLLHCDALLVPTITAFDPFDPPKMGASLTLFRKSRTYRRPADIDPRELVRHAAPSTGPASQRPAELIQAFGMFDASSGSTRSAVFEYARGRSDPNGPYGERGYLIEMDRYSGFVYHTLIAQLLARPALAGG